MPTVVHKPAEDTALTALRIAELHTRDVARAHRVAARLQAGLIWVDTYGILDVSLPFGGWRASGYGREYGPEGLDEYLQTKSVYVPF